MFFGFAPRATTVVIANVTVVAPFTALLIAPSPGSGFASAGAEGSVSVCHPSHQTGCQALSWEPQGVAADLRSDTRRGSVTWGGLVSPWHPRRHPLLFSQHAHTAVTNCLHLPRHLMQRLKYESEIVCERQAGMEKKRKKGSDWKRLPKNWRRCHLLYRL